MNPKDDPLHEVRTMNLLRGKGVSLRQQPEIFAVLMASEGTSSGTIHPVGYYSLPVWDVEVPLRTIQPGGNGAASAFIDPTPHEIKCVVINGVAYITRPPRDNRYVYHGVSRATVAIHYDAMILPHIKSLRERPGPCPTCGQGLGPIVLATATADHTSELVGATENWINPRSLVGAAAEPLAGPDYKEQLSPDEQEGGAE